MTSGRRVELTDTGFYRVYHWWKDSEVAESGEQFLYQFDKESEAYEFATAPELFTACEAVMVADNYSRAALQSEHYQHYTSVEHQRAVALCRAAVTKVVDHLKGLRDEQD